MENLEKDYLNNYINTVHEAMINSHKVFNNSFNIFNITTFSYIIMVMMALLKLSIGKYFIAVMSISYMFFSIVHLSCSTDKIKFYEKLHKAKLDVISHYTQEQKIYNFLGAESVKTLKLEVDNPTRLDLKVLHFLQCMAALLGIIPLAALYIMLKQPGTF